VNIAAVNYTARADRENGHVRDYEIYLSNDGQQWGEPVTKGRIPRDAEEEYLELPKPVKARFLKFVVLSEQSRQSFASIAELEAVEAGTGR
jgi:beta-galactosidase